MRMVEEAGSRPYFPVGILRRGCEEPEWTIYSHAERDGLGGIMHALQQAGYRIRGFPQFRDPSPPSPLAIRLSVLRTMWISRTLRTHPWRELTPRRGVFPSGHAWFLFTREQTLALRQFARGRGVSLSTILFWCANRSLPDIFARDTTAPRTWGMTVNMRGPLRLPTEFGNLSTGLDVTIPDGETVEDLERTIHRELKLNAHWVRLYWTWGCQTPERLRAFHRRWPGLAVRFRSGAFSNIGELPRDYVEPTDRSGPVSDIDAMFLGGVTGPIHPIACVPLSWNGRLGVTLCLAAQLMDDLDRTRECLSLWMEQVLSLVQSVDPAAVRAGVRAASWDTICATAVGRY